jgi:hypothetical protein
MRESSVEHQRSKAGLRRTIFAGGARLVDLTGPNGGTIVVYKVTDLVSAEIIYVGSGQACRAIDHVHNSAKVARYVEHGNYAIDVVWDGDDDNMALALESVLIFAYRPPLNHQRYGTRGGRPVGVPVTAEQRAAASARMQGRAKEWMTGRIPWNKGLTKADHPGLASSAEKKVGNRNGALKPGQASRPTGKAAWNRGLTPETSESMRRIAEAQRGRVHSSDERAKNAEALVKARAARAKKREEHR